MEKITRNPDGSKLISPGRFCPGGEVDYAAQHMPRTRRSTDQGRSASAAAERGLAIPSESTL
jgi:hypothetical protein